MVSQNVGTNFWNILSMDNVLSYIHISNWSLALSGDFSGLRHTCNPSIPLYLGIPNYITKLKDLCSQKNNSHHYDINIGCYDKL